MPSARTMGSRLSLPADFKVAQRTLRLRAPIAVRRHFDGSEGIGFCTGRALILGAAVLVRCDATVSGVELTRLFAQAPMSRALERGSRFLKR